MPKTPKKRSNGASIEVAGVLGGGSSAKIKKKIRDIERLLKKDTLPATVRTDNERALKALRVELDNANFNHRAQKNAKKYHMVRFFEKKKAIRKLKQARKTLDELVQKDAERKEIKKARKVVRHCEIDLVYVILFPKLEKYISLFPNENEPVDEAAKKGMQATEDRKRLFRKECEQYLEQDNLPFNLEDAAQGKRVIFTNENYNAREREEIDAPEENNNQEEDDFFE